MIAIAAAAVAMIINMDMIIITTTIINMAKTNKFLQNNTYKLNNK
jgi:hypothetical protein